MSPAELRESLQVLADFGLLDRVHSVGDEVVLFPIARIMSDEERADLAARRGEGAEGADRRRVFGAAGGMQPGVRPVAVVAGADDAARAARQTAKVREARAELERKSAGK